MKRSTVTVWTVAVCSGLLVGLAVAQPATAPEPQPVQPGKVSAPPSTARPIARPAPRPAAPVEQPADLSPEMKAMMDAAAPDEHHKMFDGFVGLWDGELKMWMGPATEPTENKSTVIARWDPGMGNRYLTMDHTGKIAGMAFRGTATWGYNKVAKRYEAIWRDNFSTGMMFSVGEAASDGKSMTFSGEYDEPMGSGKVRSREIYTWNSPESYKFEMFETRPGSPESKVIEAVYTKRTTTLRPGVVSKPAPGAAKPADGGEKK